MEVPESKPFIDEHGFTPSELFSSSATSVSSSSTKSLQERLADAFDDSYDEDSTSDDEYCILEENDQVSLTNFSWKILKDKLHSLNFDFVLFVRVRGNGKGLVGSNERFSGSVLIVKLNGQFNSIINYLIPYILCVKCSFELLVLE